MPRFPGTATACRLPRRSIGREVGARQAGGGGGAPAAYWRHNGVVSGIRHDWVVGSTDGVAGLAATLITGLMVLAWTPAAPAAIAATGPVTAYVTTLGLNGTGESVTPINLATNTGHQHRGQSHSLH